MKLSTLIQTKTLAIPVLVSLFGVACATTTPVELTNARLAYDRASTGPAAQYTPTDLHKAKTALDKAEQNFVEEEGSQKTIDLAYLAERSSQIAEARADAAIAEKNAAKANKDFGDKQGQMVRQTQGNLVKTREELAEAERGRAEQAKKTDAERLARQEAEKQAALSEQKAAAANDALAKLAAKEEERGLVITLSGSVLFRSNDAALLPAAQTRLDQVAEALVAKNRDVVVEGYTDSKGSLATNMSLSQRRAESVRSYLVSRGFPTEKIQARGLGPDRPIAENTSAEGRANNRRVEIVISKGGASSASK